MQVFGDSIKIERVKSTDPDKLPDVNLTPELDDLTFLATQICQTPIALILLVDADRHWFQAQTGGSAADVAQAMVFCRATMRQTDLLIVRDARADQRFATHRTVMDEPSLCFYAGAPLMLPDGEMVGVLCVLDYAPRALTPQQQQALRVLSRQVVGQLAAYRGRAEQQQTAVALQESQTSLHTLVAHGNIITWEADAAARRFIDVGPQAIAMLGYGLEAWHHPDFWLEHLHPDDREQALAFFAELSTRRDNDEFEYRMLAIDGRIVWLCDIVNLTRHAHGSPLLRGFTLNITADKQAEQAVRQRARHAEMLQIITAVAATTTDLTDLLRIALEHLLKALDLKHGEIWAPPHHIICHLLSSTAADLNQSVGGLALDVSVPLAISDWQQLQSTQPTLQRQAEIMRQLGVRASLVVPLVMAFQPLGGINLAAYQPREWEPAEIALALAIGQQIDAASQRLHAEIALQAQEDRYQGIADINFYYALTIRVKMDNTFVFEWATGGFTGITGYTSQEMVERGGMVTLIPPAALAEFRQNWQTLYQGQPTVYEYPIIDRRGELRWLREHAYPVWEKHPEQVLRVYITGEDITERKRAEEELHRTHAMYRRAIAAADAVTYQREYKTDSFSFMGEAIQQITGYTPTEMTPDLLDQISIETIMRGETEGLTEEEAFRRTRLGEFYRWRCDSRIRTRTGEDRWITDASVEIYDEHGKPSGSIGILMDITDRKQAEVALQESNHRLAEALGELRQTQQHLVQQERLRAVGTMASGIAHDFNNMLGPILGFTELLLLRPEGWHNPEKETRYLKAIHVAAQSAATVISRLREFYRFRDGIEPQLPVDLHLVVEQAILLTQPHWKDQALASGVPVRIEADLQPVPIIKGSKSELQEMLTNLILNAVNALDVDGKITIRVFVEPGKNTHNIANHVPTDVVLEISDTGMGMDEETQRHCFEPFFSTKGTHGTGLGLAVVYGIVQRHQGRIEVESMIGRGTTFRIYLPIPLQVPEFMHQPAPPSERPLHVLVVDDDPIVRDVIVEYLQYEEHSTETAANGAEGLEKFRTGQFDLVITDRAMPKLNGDGLAAAIKALAADMPIILLTGFGEFMNAEGELPRGVDYIVSKPLTLDALQQTIALAMGKFS